MGVFFVYILKSAFCLAAFYLFYRLLLSHDTFHRFNRVMLLSLMVLSCLIPFLEVTLKHSSEVNRSFISVEDLIMMQYAAGTVQMTAGKTPVISWSEVVLLIYWGGIVFFFLRNAWAIHHMFKLISSGTRIKSEDGTRLVVHGQKVPPFSWMKFIVISRKDLDENGKEILIHERAHIANGHSWDVMLADLFVFLQWFNPAAWLLKQELQNIHEYEADDTVLRKGIDAKSYQLLLIEKAVGPRLYSIANSFNHSSLKKRITMMLKEKSNPWARLKYLYVLPVAALAVAAFARPEVSDKLNEISAVKVTDLSSIVKEQTSKIEENVLPEAVQGKVDAAMKSVSDADAGQEFKIHGEVLDAEKGPVIGASVIIRNTTTGTVADANGHFTLPVHEGDVVCISYVGMQTLMFPVKASMEGKSLSLTLLDEVKEMSEVVVVGYGDKADKGENAASGRTQTKADAGSDKEPLFAVVEDMPSFPGGMNECLKFIAQNMKYPVDAQKAGIQGRVIVQYTVMKDGAIADTHVLRSVSPSLDAEALRVVNKMPNWIPGKQRGVPVNVKYTIPITFKLRPSVDEANPLVIIDGKVQKKAELDAMNPAKIKSITVMKNVDALKTYVAKYGTAANAGVIVVITKK